MYKPLVKDAPNLLSFQLKLRNVVTTQQEKLLGEREADVERQRQRMEALKSSLSQKDEEVNVHVHVESHTFKGWKH